MNVKHDAQPQRVVDCVNLDELTERQALEMSDYLYEMIRRDIKYFSGPMRSTAVIATVAAYCDADTTQAVVHNPFGVSSRCFLCHYARQMMEKHNATTGRAVHSRCDFCHVKWTDYAAHLCADEGSPYDELASMFADGSQDVTTMRELVERVQALFRERLAVLDARERKLATTNAVRAVSEEEGEADEEE